MPYKRVWCDPEIVLEHNGVTIYAAYKNNDYEAPFTCWFVTSPASTIDSPDSFDVRTLDTPTAKARWAEAMEQGRAGEYPRYRNGDFEQILREAIDAGLLRNPA